MSASDPKPWRVVTDRKVLVNEYDSEEQAIAAANYKNARAEALGIQTRYEPQPRSAA